MPSFQCLTLLGVLQACICSATTLFVASSDGNLSTLSLSSSSDSFNLIVTSVSNGCAGNPSWLAVEPESHILYCLDRSTSPAITGSLNSFTVGDNGKLSRIDRVDAPNSGVHFDFFGKSGEKQGIATASYNKSANAVFSYTNDGHLTGPLQKTYPVLTTPGPITTRQDRSYLHQVRIDPSGRYILMNDLGADLVRVYTWDATNLAPLTEVSQLKTEAGVGPRHGVFWASPATKVLYYIFVGELSQKVYSYRIEYTKTGLAWTKIFEDFAVGVKEKALAAPPSGVVLSPDSRFLLISNRDNSFSKQPVPSDHLTTWTINNDGTMKLIQLWPSGGWQPRQFSLNKKGDLLAVGHQGNGTVVLWRRDVQSGRILAGVGGRPEAVVQLSGPVVCTIWDE